MPSGSINHRRLVEKGQKFISKYENRESVDSETEYEPDICVRQSSTFDSSDFNEVWFEAEISSIRRPSNIIEKVAQASRSNAKIIFLVEAVEDKRVDYYAERIGNIIDPPSLMSHYMDKNRYRIYNSHKNLLTTSERMVLTEQGDQVEWTYDDKQNKVSCDLSNKTISVSNPGSEIRVSDEGVGKTGHINNGKFFVDSDESESYDQIQDSPYKPVKKPCYPFSIPRLRVEKVIDSVEFLIFGENVTYHRVQPKLNSYIDGLN